MTCYWTPVNTSKLFFLHLFNMAVPGYAVDIKVIFYIFPQFVQEGDIYQSCSINNLVIKLLKIHCHGWYVHIIFHESQKRKVHGCQISWSRWPQNVAATAYPYSLECLVQVLHHIRDSGRVPSCCQITVYIQLWNKKCSRISMYTWHVMVVSANNNCL
jgi:hypothetical protein